MKIIKVLGASLLLFALLCNPMSASADALTPQQKSIVSALNPNLANSTNWVITGSGIHADMFLIQNNITYMVRLNGATASWATLNSNTNTAYRWGYYLGTWTFEGEEPYGPPTMPCGI